MRTNTRIGWPLNMTLAAMLLVALLLNGACTAGRPGDPSDRHANRQVSTAALQADIATLRYENRQLTDRTSAAEQEIARLKTDLEKAREEQQRYKDMMSTNFDLLEQSVAVNMRQIKDEVKANTRKASVREETRHPVKTVRSAPPAQAPRMEPPQAAAGDNDAKPAQQVAIQRTSYSAPAATAVSARMDSAGMSGPGLNDPDLSQRSGIRTLVPHGEAKPMYERGFTLFAKKQYGHAIEAFEGMLSRFPDDIYSDNAQFWIGEAYRLQGQWTKAEGAYRAVLRNYAHRSTLEGYKTPDALFRLGQVYEQRNAPEQARIYYQAAADRFPRTSAGRHATKVLATLGLSTAAN